MPTAAFIANVATPNGVILAELLKDFGSKGTAIVGNDLETFKSHEKLGEVDILVFVVFAGGNAELISQLWPLCPNIKWVHSLAAGVETVVPILQALPRGPETPLTNAKGAFSSSLGEYALTAMLYFNKQLVRLQNQRQNAVYEKFIMAELSGKTVGFAGFGSIGQATARLCSAFGMKVLALRNSKDAPGNELADEILYSSDGDGKLELFRRSDFVICSLPGGASTKHFCGKPEFSAMKETGVFISIGRGTCVDEAALHEALTAGSIAGAALDVFEVEPLPATSPLWSLGNDKFLLSPHNADLTSTYMQLTWDVFLQKLTRFAAADFTGFAAEDQVDKSKGY